MQAAKQLKRQARRERFEQAENEKKRFVDILQLQKVLENMGDDSTRQAFIDGAEGTIKLTSEDLDRLDELYKLINPDPSAEERCAHL